MDGTLLSQYVLSGVVIGLIYSLMALGITFIYGIMKMINWGMGEFYMIGSYVQYALIATLLGPRLWWLALPLAMGAVFVLGLILQRLRLRAPRRGPEPRGHPDRRHRRPAARHDRVRGGRGARRRRRRAAGARLPRLSGERRHLHLQGLRDHRHRRARLHRGEHRRRPPAGRARGARLGVHLLRVPRPLRLRAADPRAGRPAHRPLRRARTDRLTRDLTAG